MTDSRSNLPTNLDVLGKPALQSTLISRAAFWQPRHIWASRHLKTIPFFFWLVESILPHRILQIGLDDGVSFLSFCQSVDKLRLDASCIGLTLDEGEATLAQMFDAQEACYPDFSLIEKYVSGHLNDKTKHQSIDMLVVGSSVTDSLLSDLRADLFSRLTENSVVVILDPEQLFFSAKGKEILNSLEAEWSIVKSSNDRSAPLVLFKGPEPSERLLRLSEMSPESPEHLMFWQIFHRLGQGIANSQLAAEREKSINILQAKVDQLSNVLEDYEEQIAALRTDAKTQRETEESQAEQITILRTGLGQLQTHQATQTSQIDELEEKLGEAQEKRQAFYVRCTELQKERDGLAQSLATRTDDLASLSAEYEACLSQMQAQEALQNSQIDELQEKRQTLYVRCTELQKERDELAQSLAARTDDLASLSAEYEARLNQLQAQEAVQTSQIDELQEKMGEAQEKRQSFYARCTELQKERDELAEGLATRTDDLASLSADYEIRLDQLEVLKEKQTLQIAKLREELEASQEKRQLFYTRSVDLQSERDALKSEVEERIQDISFLSLDTENRMKDLGRDLKIALQNLEKIKGSTSWRLSSPIRKLKRLFR